ncbi:WSC domain containing protein [Pyrenophora tritici-repentis]|nr:WSC domain containing protein [Pyrenophora tritici-repentis]
MCLVRAHQRNIVSTTLSIFLGTAYQCNNAYKSSGSRPSLTCTDPSQNKETCSCTCTHDIVFDQPILFHGQAGNASNTDCDCEDVKEECSKRQKECDANIATQQSLLKREQQSTADLQKESELLKQEPDIFTKLQDWRKKPYVHLGCYINSADRILSDRVFYNQAAMTLDLCESYCDTYEYYGLQVGGECYCGQTLKPSSNSTECNYKCVGDKSKTCGGNWKMEVNQKKE